MSKHTQELIEAVKEITEAGWHQTTRVGNTGIGKTFEDLLEKEEDNHDLPDFHDIEIKTHETASASMLTLFTKSPTNPRGANTMLRNLFGKLDDYGNNILHATVSGNRKTKSKEYKHDFKIDIDWEEKKVNLLVYDQNDQLVLDTVYWSFNSLQTQIDKKLKYLAIISAQSKIENGIKYYQYKDVDLVTDLNVESLCKGIENGDIKVDIRIGAYHSGKNLGKTHDHGTAFRINLKTLLNYAEVVKIA